MGSDLISSLSLHTFYIIFHMLMTWGQGQEMPLTFNTNISTLTQLVVCIYQLQVTVLTLSYKKPKLHNFTFPK